jgi:hypothetical protein
LPVLAMRLHGGVQLRGGTRLHRRYVRDG